MAPKSVERPAARSIQGALFPIMGPLLILCIGYLAVGIETAQYLSVVLFALCGFGAASLLKRNILAIWSPMFWFLVASAVYYGIGPLIYLYGDSAIIEYLRSYYAVDDDALARTNLLSAVSIFLICLIYEISLRMVPVPYPRAATYDPDCLSQRSLLLFAAIGYLARVAIYTMRLSYGDEVVINGILFSLAELAKVAALLAAYRFAAGYRGALILVLGLGGAELFLAVGSLMKQNVLEVLLMLFLGVLIAKPQRKVIFAAAIVCITTYMALVPMFSAARDRYWAHGPTSLSTEIKITGNLLGGEALVYDSISDSVWWARLSPASAQAFAMDAYDAGAPGPTFRMAPFTFVPRAIWPEKPIITYGDVFTATVTGTDIGGGSSPGFFGEAYWNFGWAGVLLMALITGVIYAFFSKLNIQKLAERDLSWIPIAYLSLKMGYRPDDWFVATVIGTIPIMIAVWIIIRVVPLKARLAPRRREV